jgi:hypothetical protein
MRRGHDSREDLVAAQAGEVLLVDGRAGGGTGTTTAATRSSSSSSAAAGSTTTGTTASGTVTTGSTVATGSAVTTTATTRAGGGAGAGLLNEAHVNVKEVLLLALLLTLLLLGGGSNVAGLALSALQLGGSGPLLVLLDTLVGGTDGLGSQAVAGSLLGEVVVVRLGLVGLLDLLSGSLGLLVVLLGDVLANALVIPGLLAGLVAPALLDLLASVAVIENNC